LKSLIPFRIYAKKGLVTAISTRSLHQEES
jgi:hypothetical protein